MTGIRAKLACVRGQATVEAAFMLPVVMLLLLLLLQPSIVLYDRMIMQGAASEACRLLATSAAGDRDDCEAYVRRRLAAIPQHDLFHIHGEGACSWQIELEGNESSSEVSVRIVNELRPLPLLDIGAALLNVSNAHGNLEIEVEAKAAVQPAWVSGSEHGLNPGGWIGAWL